MIFWAVLILGLATRLTNYLGFGFAKDKPIVAEKIENGGDDGGKQERASTLDEFVGKR